MNVQGREGLDLEAALARDRVGRGVPAGRGQIGQDPFADLVVVDGAGGRHHEGVGGVGALVVLPHGVARNRGDGLVGAADGSAQRGVLTEGGAGESLLGDVGRVIGGIGQLGDDDAALGLDVGRLQERGGHHVGEHVEGRHAVGGEHAGVVGGVLLGRGGVGLPADHVEGLGDVVGVACSGALEEQVLQEVGGALLAGLLVAAPDAEPHADRGRAQARHGLGDDPHPTGQDGAAGERTVVVQGELGAVAARPAPQQLHLGVVGRARGLPGRKGRREGCRGRGGRRPR